MTAFTILAKLSSRRMMSDASLATSVPLTPCSFITNYNYNYYNYNNYNYNYNYYYYYYYCTFTILAKLSSSRMMSEF